MKVQVWVRDSYGQGSIVKTCDDPKSAIDFAKKYVSDTNFDNALTPVERQRNWAGPTLGRRMLAATARQTSCTGLAQKN